MIGHDLGGGSLTWRASERALASSPKWTPGEEMLSIEALTPTSSIRLSASPTIRAAPACRQAGRVPLRWLLRDIAG